MTNKVSDIFDPSEWEEVPGFDFKDITYHRALTQGTVRVAFNRPEVRNAFRPQTVDELFVGEKAEEIKKRALNISKAMIDKTLT